MPNPQLVEFVLKNIHRGDSVLDIGCGIGWVKEAIVARDGDATRVMGIDAVAACRPAVICDISRGLQGFFRSPFDVVLLLDVVEHLDKDTGRLVVKDAVAMARKRVLVLTPLWWTENEDPYNDPDGPWFQRSEVLHRSQWDAADFPGVDGWVSHPLQDIRPYLLVTREAKFAPISKKPKRMERV